MAYSDPVQFDLRRGAVHLWRGVRLRCPNCGGGGLFTRWVQMRRTCPSCHLILDRREPDYFLGGYVVNFVTAEFTIALGALAAIVLTWPAVPWTLIKWSLILLMIPAPVITYPFSKTIWLAIDLTLRPPTWADLEWHGENVPAEPFDPVGL
ncbi:MAG: DUF983 domain-containing protein [Gemmatimonadota bacterium]